MKRALPTAGGVSLRTELKAGQASASLVRSALKDPSQGPVRATVCLVFAILALPSGGRAQEISLPAPASPERIKDLKAQIVALREIGNYAEAATRSRNLVSVLRATHVADSVAAPRWTVVEWEHLTRAAERAASMSESAQQELAEAERLQQECEDHYARGEYAPAIAAARRQWEIRRRLLGEGSHLVAVSIANCGLFLQDSGDYAAAEPLLREALRRLAEIFGNGHPLVASSYNRLGRLRFMQGDMGEAEELYREALAARVRLSVDQDLQVPAVRNNLAKVLGMSGRYAEAESLYRLSWDGFLRLKRSYAATSIANLAGVLRRTGRRDEADRLYQKALDLISEDQGSRSSDFATVLGMRAMLLEARGEFVQAESLLVETLAIRRQRLNSGHPNLCASAHNLGLLRLQRGRPAEALGLLEEAAAIFEAARLRAGSGMERATFLGTSPYPALAATRLLLGKESGAWTALENSQGRVLADLLLTAESRGLSPAEAQEESNLRLALGDQERQLEAFRRAARADSSADATRRAEEARTHLLEAEARWSAFEREVAIRHPVTEGRAFQLARVQSALGADEALAGWLDLRGDQQELEPQSWGYVIRNQGPVQWQRLSLEPPAENLNGRLKRWVDQLKACRGEDPQTRHRVSVAEVLRLEVSRRPLEPQDEIRNASVLWQERFAPLMRYLEGVRHLIVIPSGEMLGTPVEALAIAGSRETIGDRFAVSYAPSATIYTWLAEKRGEEERLRPGTASRPGDGLCLAVADPPFRAEDLAATSLGADAPVASTLASASLFRSLEIPEDSLGSDEEALLRSSALAGSREALAKLKRLPATRAEASAIVAGSTGGSRLLLGPEASEQELVRMAENGELRRYRTIHLATHALVDDERPERSALVLSQVDLPDQYEAAVKGERIYDGLLDAREIVREWKLDADLVTLSACETGLGKKVVGEGYVGLAHAFLQAGARSLLVSLWRVEDRSTSMLMDRFYENWRGRYTGSRGAGLAPGASLPKVEALQEAKRWLREWRDEVGRQPYRHPYYWAGFVLIGEPA